MPEICKGYRPGAIGRVAEMHAEYYARHWNFGPFFEAKVATELADFMIRYDTDRDAFWSVVENDRIEGSITIDGIHAHDEGAHLRWFIMSDVIRGEGFGNRLLHDAISFCKKQHYPRVYLWTFSGLHAARKLYEKFGFMLVHEEPGTQWGTASIEQKFILKIS